MDGWITIGTRLDTTKFDKEVSNLEGKIDSAEKKQELINQKTNQYEQDLKQVSSNVNQLVAEYEKAAQKAEELRNTMKTSSTSFGAFQATKEYEEQVKKVDELAKNLDKAEAKQQSITNKVEQSKLQYENIGKTIDSYRAKLELLNLKQKQNEVEEVKKSFDKVGDSIGSSIKNVARLALGIFSLRSAYNLVHQASSTLGQYDTQYAANIEYIRYALAQGIAPILRGIVNLAGQLLSYLNYIFNSWFGINLFANAGAKSFAKMQNSAASTAKSAKEIKKQLAGFDEMTVLGDSNQDSLGGGSTLGGGIGDMTIPDIDLSSWQGEVPSWIKWIAEHKGEVISGLAGIAGGLLAIKILNLEPVSKALGGISKGAKALMGLGIGVAIAGLVYTIQSIVEFIKDPTWENFSNILVGVSITLAGIALIMLAINAANPIAWIILLIAVIAGIVAIVIKNWDKIKEVLKVVGNWIYEHIIQPVDNFFSTLWENIKTGVSNLWNAVMSLLSPIFNWVNEHIIQPIWNQMKKGMENIKKIVTTVWEGIKTIVTSVVNTLKKGIEIYINLVKTGFNNIKTIATNIWNGIKTVVTNVVNGMKNGIEGFKTTFKNVFNTLVNIAKAPLNMIIKIINTLIDGINKVHFDVPDWVPGIRRTKMGL